MSKITSDSCRAAIVAYYETQCESEPMLALYTSLHQEKQWKRTSKTGNSTDGFERTFVNRDEGLKNIELFVTSTDTEITNIFRKTEFGDIINPLNPIEEEEVIEAPPLTDMNNISDEDLQRPLKKKVTAGEKGTWVVSVEYGV